MTTRLQMKTYREFLIVLEMMYKCEALFRIEPDLGDVLLKIYINCMQDLWNAPQTTTERKVLDNHKWLFSRAEQFLFTLPPMQFNDET